MPFARTHIIMPKVPRGCIIAMDKATGLYEIIRPSKELCLKFKRAGAPVPTIQPRWYTVQTPILSTEEQLELLQLREERKEQQTLLSRLTLERRRLEDRITDPPLPLIECISDSPSDIHIPPPIPQKLHFHKSKILNCIKEIFPLLEATKTHLEPLFKKLNEMDCEEEIGHAVKVPKEKRDKLWKWYNCFEDLYENLEELGHKLTQKEWRELKGALKRIGRVSFLELDNRLSEICKELVNLNITFP